MSSGFLELAGSIFSFAGGLVLTAESLLVRRRVREESGADLLLTALGRVGAADQLKDSQGQPLSQERALQLWFAHRSFRWAWLGFALMALGFLFELFSRLQAKG